jgi:hypothetical protein
MFLGGIARISKGTPRAAVQTRASARLAEHALRARRVWTDEHGVSDYPPEVIPPSSSFLTFRPGCGHRNKRSSAGILSAPEQ